MFVQPRPNVIWVTGDALDPTTYKTHLEKARAVVISIGAPPIPYADEEKQIRMNGRTNTEVCFGNKYLAIHGVIVMSR